MLLVVQLRGKRRTSTYTTLVQPSLTTTTVHDRCRVNIKSRASPIHSTPAPPLSLFSRSCSSSSRRRQSIAAASCVAKGGKEYPGGEGRQQPKVAGEEDGRKEGCFTQPATHPREESNLRKQAPRRRLRWRERRRRQRLRSLQEGREEDLKPYCTLSRAMWSSLTEPMASQRPWMEAEALVQPISPLFSNIGGQRSSSLASPLYATQDAATSVGKGTHSLPC